MNVDPYTKKIIHNQGIWTQTNCLAKERAVFERISHLVQNQGFQPSASDGRLWHKGDRSLVICLVDDVISVSKDYETDMPYLFDRNTLVITDNYISCPTLCDRMTLPRSFFGIYHHDVREDWNPDREFTFSVNRIDDRRFKLMLELALRVHLPHGYVNFNCQKDYFAHKHVPNDQELRANFLALQCNLSDQEKQKYRGSFDMLAQIMPYRNYDIDHEDIHTRSWCNFIVESYGSDTTVAFSEKIFRALLLPVPWTLYGGSYAVAYLESLGFDCMSDLINHNHYDRLKEIEDKARIYIWFSLKFMREAQQMDQQNLLSRCQTAALHNRRRLIDFQNRWSSDFQNWLNQLEHKLSSQ